MRGDSQVSTKAFARALNVKAIRSCDPDPDTAHKQTGYFVGGTSPLGLKKRLKICFETFAVKLYPPAANNINNLDRLWNYEIAC
jgi:prolyl-tRNA editing enzyme YbaK/EbsC (Cys-tRNA(Pro) deacylase)